MKILAVLGGVLALICYVPLIHGIIKNRITPNLATWLLWSVLDYVIFGSIFVQHGNYFLPLAFSIGGTAVVAVLLFKQKPKWTRFETLITMLVVGCLVAWYLGGPWVATITGTLAMLIAGIPEMVATYRKPENGSTLVWALYTVANTLSFLGGVSWTVQEKLFPASGILYCGILVILCLRRNRTIFFTPFEYTPDNKLTMEANFIEYAVRYANKNNVSKTSKKEVLDFFLAELYSMKVGYVSTTGEMLIIMEPLVVLEKATDQYMKS